MVGPVKISYVCGGVPPYGVVEFVGDMQLLDNGDRAVAAQPPTGNGPYAIDDGKGTNGTYSGKYGTAIIPYDNVAWVAWDGNDPGEAWKSEVGPLLNRHQMGKGGRGYYYAGVKDQENNRMLVVQKIPSPVRMICVTLGSPDNAWVYRPISGRTVFRAAIVDSDTVTTVQELLDPANKFVLCDVYTRFIAGGIFTGNEFLGIKNVDTRSSSPMIYDVVSNPALYRFKATITGERKNVKIQFTQYLRNTASRTATCTDSATNDTGRYLSTGQNVWVEWTQDGWRITDFECYEGPPT